MSALYHPEIDPLTIAFTRFALRPPVNFYRNLVYAIHPIPHSVKSKVTIRDEYVQTGTIYYKKFHLNITRDIKPRHGAIHSEVSLLITIKEFTIDGQKLNAELQCLFCDPYVRIFDTYANEIYEQVHQCRFLAKL